MAGVADHENHHTQVMAGWIITRKTTVIGDINLPRPKIVQDVVFRGEREAAERHLQAIVNLPQNQSTDIISCEIKLQKDEGQKTGTSARPGNGKR